MDRLDKELGTPIYPENVGFALGSEYMKVPYSELAMHTRIADNDVLVFKTDGQSACVVSVDKDGASEFTCGGAHEVLRPEVVRAAKHLWGKKRQ